MLCVSTGRLPLTPHLCVDVSSSNTFTLPPLPPQGWVPEQVLHGSGIQVYSILLWNHLGWRGWLMLTLSIMYIILVTAFSDSHVFRTPLLSTTCHWRRLMCLLLIYSCFLFYCVQINVLYYTFLWNTVYPFTDPFCLGQDSPTVLISLF